MATAEHQSLVAKIKEGQRASEEWKQAWWSYCDANGLGKKDPAAHSTEVLQQFINTHSHIHLDLSSPAPLKPVPVPPPATVGGVLVAKIKEGQRASQEWKQAWWDYCNANGLAQYDPAVHPTEVLRQFIDTHTHIHLSNPAPGPSPAVAPAAPAATAEHQSLVAKIKEGQSASEEWKQAWWNYCVNELPQNLGRVHCRVILSQAICITVVPPRLLPFLRGTLPFFDLRYKHGVRHFSKALKKQQRISEAQPTLQPHRYLQTLRFLYCIGTT